MERVNWLRRSVDSRERQRQFCRRKWRSSLRGNTFIHREPLKPYLWCGQPVEIAPWVIKEFWCAVSAWWRRRRWCCKRIMNGCLAAWLILNRSNGAVTHSQFTFHFLQVDSSPWRRLMTAYLYQLLSIPTVVARPMRWTDYSLRKVLHVLAIVILLPRTLSRLLLVT